ncbi:hypothetical protein VTO42DRAFT_2124 [Malbranchea cinnamomea]
MTGGFSVMRAQGIILYSLESDPKWVRLGRLTRDFVKRLLVKDGSARMTATEALAHEWMATCAAGPVDVAWTARENTGCIVHDFSTDWDCLMQYNDFSAPVTSQAGGTQDDSTQGVGLEPFPPIVESSEHSLKSPHSNQTSRKCPFPRDSCSLAHARLAAKGQKRQGHQREGKPKSRVQSWISWLRKLGKKKTEGASSKSPKHT